MKQGLGLWCVVACVLAAANGAEAGSGKGSAALSTEQVQQLKKQWLFLVAIFLNKSPRDQYQYTEAH